MYYYNLFEISLVLSADPPFYRVHFFTTFVEGRGFVSHLGLFIPPHLSLCERFEPRSHFKSRLSLIVRVNVVLNRTVVVNSD